MLEEYKDIQTKTKNVLSSMVNLILPSDTEHSISQKAYHLLCEMGLPNTWYYDCPAFVLLGSRSCVSMSGSNYIPNKEEQVGLTNLVTIDLSPCENTIWGDCARSFCVENGQVVLQEIANPTMTFQDLSIEMNKKIAELGFENLDFKQNIGHSITDHLDKRLYIEQGNTQLLSAVSYFTCEPHIRKKDSKWGFKHENIYYFSPEDLIKVL